MARAGHRKKAPVVPLHPNLTHEEAELQVLGLSLLRPEYWDLVYSHLCPTDFTKPLHRHIFECMQDLHADGLPIDVIHLADRVDNQRISGAELSELADRIPPGNPKHWVQLLIEKSSLRRVQSLGRDISKLATKGDLEACLALFHKETVLLQQRSLWPISLHDAQWQTRLTFLTEKRGRRKLERLQNNYVIVLANHPELRGTMVFDEFRQDVACLRAPPWNKPPYCHDYGTTAVGGTWLEEDYTRLQGWLEAEYGTAPTKELLCDYVVMVAQRERHHPVRDALEAMVWDGTARLDTWLQDYLGARGDPDYLALVGTKWMISAVARVLCRDSDGCKADHVLILEGVQGIGKSTALRTLATVHGKSWFTDTPLHLNQKDAFLSLQGKWIVELAELDTLIRAEDATAKAFFTSNVDNFRPPYARRSRDFPRQCVFAGTVNEDDYLRDKTGGRRYWPVKCYRIEHEALRRDQSQLWAEAVARYKQGEAWHPTTEQERALCSIEQVERLQEDPWLPAVLKFLRDNSLAEDFTSEEILHGAIFMSTEKISRREQNRLGRLMAQVPGWEPGRIYREESRVRGYKRTSWTSGTTEVSTEEGFHKQEVR